MNITEIMNHSCDLDLGNNRAIQYFLEDNPAYDDVPSYQV